MAAAKRVVKSKGKAKGTTKKKGSAPGKKKGAVAKPQAAKKARVPISALTGLPVREKIHLPIQGYGRLNGFGVLENLFGKSVAQLKEILEYEEKHQARRMVIDRINDMLRRAGVK